MFIKQLYVHNFRNIDQLLLNANKNYNILYGRNAQGKTNTLEAICLLLKGKTHRINSNKGLIKKNTDKADIWALIDRNEDVNLKAALTITQKRRFSLDGEFLKSRSQLLRNFSTILFTPEDLRIVKEGPSLRRDFLDESISTLYPAYYDILKSYNKILKERNSLLKEYKIDKNNPLLDVYDDSLSQFGCKIIRYRISVLKLIEKEANILYKTLSKDEDITFLYSSNVISKASDIDNINEVYSKCLKESRLCDIEKRSSCTGVHLDDINILLNEESAKAFASQGQQRSISLCMKLSLIKLIKEKTGDAPIVLLDDVMSELDSFRQHQLMNLLKDTQSFITCVSLDFIKNENITSSDISLFEVRGGEVKLSCKEEDIGKSK